MHHDVYRQTSPTQGELESTAALGSWATGISSDYRSYNPANSKFANVATTRAGTFDPQRGIANIMGSGRFSTEPHRIANSSQVAAGTTNRLTYLAQSASRPTAYHWGQEHQYIDPTNAIFANQATNGLSFYRLSNKTNVVLDQFKTSDLHWLYYNQTTLDNNLLTISNSGAVSKIEAITAWQDNTTNPTTPLFFQTHGGMPADTTSTWHTDYSRDSLMVADGRETYIIYRPNFGSNISIPADIETMGEWRSNRTGERSGSKKKK